MKIIKLFLIVTVFSLFVSCNYNEQEQVSVFQDIQEINDGDPEPNEPGVVYISSYGACTGTLIAPNVVLTAKHCVVVTDETSPNYGLDIPVGWFTIGIGASSSTLTHTYGVSSIRKSPGVEIEDQDIALLILSSDIPESVAVPYEIALTTDEGVDALVEGETDIHIIGYGESICGQDGNAGVKLRTTDTFQYFMTETLNDFVTQGRGSNHGDSGGPLFNTSMRLMGIVSRGPEDCVGEFAGLTIATSIAHHLDFIREGMEAAGHCGKTYYSDICDDSIDNECNGQVDNGCGVFEDPCTNDWQCESNVCMEVDGSKQCMESCDIHSAINICNPGYYCKVVGCDQAYCAPGSIGTKEYYESCTGDSDCKSRFCRSATDGVMRCLIPCSPGSDECMVDEVCAEVTAGCGGCSSISGSVNRNLGEPCSSNSQCSDGYCHSASGVNYCSKTCVLNVDCDGPFHCVSGKCEKGNIGELGDPCETNEDCNSLLQCEDFGKGLNHCSKSCSPGDNCGKAGYLCIFYDTGNWCTSSGGDVGDKCGSSSPCKAGLSCMDVDGSYRCLEMCVHGVNSCPALTGCTAMNSDYCVPLGMIGGSDDSSFWGCSSSGNKKTEINYFLFLIIGLIFINRKRFARRLSENSDHSENMAD
jgi:Trypsin